MDSSLSSVPPVCPRPRPLILGTGTPTLATNGAKTRVVVSPTPPFPSCPCSLIPHPYKFPSLSIINVCADEKILTDGEIDPAKLEPITFDPVHHKYIKLGEVVGNVFKDGLKLKG